MANINVAAIITRVREIVDDAAGSLRTIASARFGESFAVEMTSTEQSRKAVSGPKYDVRLVSTERHPSNPPVSGSTMIYTVHVEVTVARHLNVSHATIDANRDTILSAAIEDADYLCQALTYPGSMTQTSAAVATGLASGCLLFDGSSSEIVLNEAGGHASLVRAVHKFHGIAVVITATS